MKKCEKYDRGMYAKWYCIKHYKRYRKYWDADFVKQKMEYHWMTWTAIYRLYAGIVSRCKSHKDYKARWIICEWTTFKEFYDDMGHGYTKWLTIDRTDNDWNYSKENCSWVDMKTQCNNRRNNINIEYQWRTQTLMQWCEELVLPYKTIYSRINRYWYSTHMAFTKSITNKRDNKWRFI